MTAATIITLRETLEASLVIGIVLTYLQTVDQRALAKWVWRGVAAGIAASALAAVIFMMTLGGFQGTAEALYEGIIMVTAAGLITWMIAWMLEQKRHIRRNIEAQVDDHIQKNYPLGIFMLIFLSVVREGVETVLFLHAAYLQASGAGMQLLGAGVGIVVAIVIAYLFFKGLSHLSLRRCFNVTSILLILFAAGLLAHGVHELQEAGVLPIYVKEVWNLNPTVLVEGVYPLMHEKGTIGSLLKAVFGYNGNPTLLEVLVYVAYLLGIAAWWRKIDAKA